MSAVESAQQAARLTDPVGHSLGMLGMAAGAVFGAVVAGLLIAGGIVTGGALIAVVVAGCVAGGGLAGGQLLRGIQRAAGLSNPTSGAIGIGSPNVRIGSLPAARALADFAAGCSGIPLNHFPQSNVPIAEGSATVRINGMLAARVTSKLVCGAPIIKGKETVYIGGPTQQVLPIHDNEQILQEGLQWLGITALAGGAVLAAAAGGAALLGFAAWSAGGMIGFAGLGWIGDQIGPGWRDILQGAGGLLALGAAGRQGLRGMQEASARQALVREFYTNAGWNEGRANAHLRGIDFSKPVEVVTLPKGTEVVQWQVPGRPTGNYFAPPGTPASKLGIYPEGRVPARRVVNRDTTVLRSTAKSTSDTWSVPGQSIPVGGGGTQYFTSNSNHFTPLP